MDGEPIPLAPDAGEYGPDVIGPVREMKTPISVDQPMGPSFSLNGQSVSWQNWRFHFRIDPRRGLVVSLVRWAEGETERMIVYQGSISELFVPYSSPEEPWSYQSFFDLGSYANVFGGGWRTRWSAVRTALTTLPISMPWSVRNRDNRCKEREPRASSSVSRVTLPGVTRAKTGAWSSPAFVATSFSEYS